ncbi:uncharacterized protein LOC6036411 isoform X2 [Culex quinquefasciatus]|uniref:uncharacterized protein LOC6036411 isoform X2 n=1 Tax=Culex quinquefasciatus TaxID=7176 RepID=UPI0018E33882|nr:uncharacterized protein LOC6036411 isoform X2 [Culex quinquefasciatus]XP_039443412.1 uncharacterized protein LOC120423612 isoform X2 [Culex pipiens pallens]
MENVATDDVIAESLGVGDLGQDMPKLPFGADGNFKMPSLDEFIKMLEGMDSLSDEEKEQLKQDVLKNSMTGRKMEAGFSDYLVFLTMIVLIASVFVFFGYKLYLSLTEKERKREEKLKAKQIKKKK